MAAAWFGEMIPVVDVAPFWTADAIFIWLSVRAEEGGIMGKVAGVTTNVVQKRMPGGSGGGTGTTPKTPPPLPKTASSLSNQPLPITQKQSPPPLPPQPPPVDRNAYQKGANYIQGGVDYIRGDKEKPKTLPNVADTRQTINSNPKLVDLRNSTPPVPPNSVDLRRPKPHTDYN